MTTKIALAALCLALSAAFAFKVAEGAIDKTAPGTFSLSETFDVGVDNGTPVSNNYKAKDQFPFTGEIDKVVINLIPDAVK